MTTSPIWSGVGDFLGRIIIFPYGLDVSYLIQYKSVLLKIFLAIFLSLQDVMKWTLLHFPVSFWLDIVYGTCWTVVGYFIKIINIYTLVLFCAVKSKFQGILFVYWEIYDMLWCSHYFATIPIGVPLGGKLSVTSNISYFVKGWYEI